MSASTSPMGSGTWIHPAERDPAKIVQAIRRILEGRLNACGTFTLASNATSTIVSNQPNVGPNSVIKWQPISTNAAPQMTLMAITSQGYSSTNGFGFFTVAHGSNAATDQTFAYTAIG